MSGEKVKCNGDGWEDGWSLRARLVIRPGLEDGGLTVTAEGGRATASPGSFPTATVTTPPGASGSAPSCSVTLNAGPHHTLTLTCTPGPTSIQRPPQPPPPPPSREVASQTSHSLIPHLLQQLNTDNVSQGVAVQQDLKRGNPGIKCSGVKTGVRSGNVDKGKNPRTVHIDVYCTESSDSCSSEESVSSPQTVYESGKSRVVHERKGTGDVPRAMTGSLLEEPIWEESASRDVPRHGLRRDKRRELSTSEVGTTRGTCGSSGYPSLVSSAAWSGLASENSIWSVESSAPSLAQTDSFDYENSRDKLRIMEKDREWGARQSSNWVSSDEESSESSGPELAWSFAEADGGGLRRNETVRRGSPPLSLSDSDLTKPQPSVLPQTFGPIIRRANRHIGPTKNPNCPCDTCKFYFSSTPS